MVGNGGATGSSSGSFGGQSSGPGSFGNGGQGSASSGGSRGAGVTEVIKDIYVHVPPPEDPEEFEGDIGGGSVQRKHYKIIFIKAPSVSIDQQFGLGSGGGGQEKTIVYVLVKKPDLNTELETARENLGKKNKPEVYFIKYKSKKQGGATTAGVGNTGSGFGTGAGTGAGGQLFQRK